MANYYTTEPTQREAQWGATLKGVAKVVAVVTVAAVVGYLAFTALSGVAVAYLGANAGVDALAAGAHTGLAATALGVGWLAGSVANILSSVPAGLANLLGLTGEHLVTTAAETTALNHAVGIGGAVAAGAVTAHAMIPAIDHTQLATVTPVDHSVMATPVLHPPTMSAHDLVGTVPMHDLTHITHHAAEHAHEAGAHVNEPAVAPAWTDRYAPRSTAYASYADNVRSSKEEGRAIPPAANFTEQLNTDRANLDQLLAK